MTSTLEIESFGYGHQPAPDAHLVIDLRCHFHDPHIQLDMRQLTARDHAIRNTVMATPGIRQLLAGIVQAIEGILAWPAQGVPIRVALGRTGGRHRVVDRTNES